MIKNYLILSIFTVLVFGCGVKRTQQMLTTGDYDAAIDKSISNLRSNKDKKSNQEFVYILEEAFAKVVERDVANIAFMKKEGNANNAEKIYNTYLSLVNRQDKI